MAKLEMTRDVMRHYFRHDHESGVLYWKESRPREGMTPQNYGSWLSTSAGRPAGSLNSCGKKVVRISGHSYQVARIILALNYGEVEKKAEVSFKNGDPSDTRLENLILTKPSDRAKSKKSPAPKGMMGRELKRGMFDHHLRLDAETGRLYWREDAPHGYRSHANHLAWLARFGGKEAGSINRLGYRIICLLGNFYLAHRIVVAMTEGRVAGDMDVDHIDGNKLNNKPENLRVVTHSVNNRNHKLFSSNTSGHNGVYRRRDTGKYVAFHGFEDDGERKVRVLGGFETMNEAIDERMRWESENGFTDRHTRDS